MPNLNIINQFITKYNLKIHVELKNAKPQIWNTLQSTREQLVKIKKYLCVRIVHLFIAIDSSQNCNFGHL